jgi:hypothetical protein
VIAVATFAAMTNLKTVDVALPARTKSARGELADALELFDFTRYLVC